MSPASAPHPASLFLWTDFTFFRVESKLPLESSTRFPVRTLAGLPKFYSVVLMKLNDNILRTQHYARDSQQLKKYVGSLYTNKTVSFLWCLHIFTTKLSTAESAKSPRFESAHGSLIFDFFLLQCSIGFQLMLAGKSGLGLCGP